MVGSKKNRESSLHEVHPNGHSDSGSSNPRVLGSHAISKLLPSRISPQHALALAKLPPKVPVSNQSPLVDPKSPARLSPCITGELSKTFTFPVGMSKPDDETSPTFDKYFGNNLPAGERKSPDTPQLRQVKFVWNTAANVSASTSSPSPLNRSSSSSSASSGPSTPVFAPPVNTPLRRPSDSDPRLLRRTNSTDHVERFDWIQSQPLSQISLLHVNMWKKIGKKGMETFEPKFCDVQSFTELIQLRTLYHDLGKHHAQDARGRSNPYELVGNGVFQNRAGMKLANIDCDLGFLLTEPRNQDGSQVVGGSEILYFVDICAGPGGFSEYILYRKGFESKGFGMTLRKSDLDFNIDEIKAGPAECFEPYYGANNDGNVYDPANVKTFIHLVLKSTDNMGVQLVLADGGFEIKGQECTHESMCKQLYLSQFLIALSVLRERGNFVCKLFDTVSLFSVGLIYLMHLCYDEMTIYKPRMSRPHNAERYMICKSKRPGIEPIIKYFSECHQLMWEWSNQKSQLQEFDILELVPIEILQKHTESQFCEKMHSFNTRGAKSQVLGLKSLLQFVQDPLLKDERQEKFRVECFRQWKIPLCETRIIGRSDPSQISELTDETYQKLWKLTEMDIRDLKEHVLVLSELEAIFKSPYDWRVIVVQGCSTNKLSRGFYMGQGGKDVFRYNLTTGEWEEPPFTIELPKDTLVFGECVMEFEGFGSHQKRSRVFHLIDGLVVNGRDIRHLHYIARHEILNRLAKSVNKASRYDLSLVRAKQLVRMENIEDVLDKCQKQELKGETGKPWTCPIDHTDERSPIIKAAGILFLKLTKDPWMMALSKSSNRKYWFNNVNGQSRYTVPQEAVSNFFDTMQHRIMWQWNDDTNLDVPDPESGIQVVAPKSSDGDTSVHSFHFLEYLRKYLRPSEPKTPK